MSEQKNSWISDALASSRNQGPGETPETLNSAAKDQSKAEYLLAVGKIVNARCRRGIEVETIASILRFDANMSNLAQAFANSSPSVIFTALMEDWSFEEIQAAVCKSNYCLASV